MLCWFSPNELSALSLRKNDLLVAEGGSIGRCTILSDDLPEWGFQKSLNRVRVRNNADIRFHSYLIQSATECGYVAVLCGRSTIQHFTADKLANLDWPHPSSLEQKAIADFLDRETAKVDGLIDKQEQLIATVREDRAAAITHAVTKRLDPNVEMNESVVEWLGPVPSHWKVMAMKHALSEPITDGPHETPEFLDDGVEFISAEAVSSGEIDFERRRGFISRADHARYSRKYSPRLHDIYVVKSGATTGVSAMVSVNREFNIWSPLAALRCGNDIDPYFLLSFIRSRNFQDAIARSWSYGTQQNIGMGVLGDLRAALPPIAEQRQIVEHINRLDAPIAELIGKASSAIDILREYRSALITDAVTGKIDVRGAA
jgi:type I restriction enzyme S subunit